MSEKRRKEESYLEINEAGEKRVKISVFLRAFMQRLMGIAIDNGRMSINTDRQFQQFERSTKDKFYQITEDSIRFLETHGAISHDDENKSEQDNE